MRSRWFIGLAVVLFSVASVRPAEANGWSAFVSWLSSLDPGSSKGFGVEFELTRLAKRDQTPPPYFGQLSEPKGERFRIKASTSLLAGKQDGQIGKAYVWPVTVVLEVPLMNYVHVGAGGGFLRVGGIPGPNPAPDATGTSVTTGLLNVRLTLAAQRHVGVRLDYYRAIPGFDANVFGPNQRNTGQENVWGVSVFVH